MSVILGSCPRKRCGIPAQSFIPTGIPAVSVFRGGKFYITTFYFLLNINRRAVMCRKRYPKVHRIFSNGARVAYENYFRKFREPKARIKKTSLQKIRDIVDSLIRSYTCTENKISATYNICERVRVPGVARYCTYA